MRYLALVVQLGGGTLQTDNDRKAEAGRLIQKCFRDTSVAIRGKSQCFSSLTVTDDGGALIEFVRSAQYSKDAKYIRTSGCTIASEAEMVTGPDSQQQGKKPHGHTCFNWIALPDYKTFEELAYHVSEGIYHTETGYA